MKKRELYFGITFGSFYNFFLNIMQSLVNEHLTGVTFVWPERNNICTLFYY